MQARIKNWVDEHREFMVLAFVLPIGFVFQLWQKFVRWRQRPDPALHQARVARIAADVQRYAAARARGEPEGMRLLRTDRRGETSLNTRMSDKQNSLRVYMGDMSAILGVDHARMVVRVEPFATTGDVAKYLDQRGLMMENTIEMTGATLGGLVLAIGMTTHGHYSGLVHDTVEAFELITAQGEWIRAEREGAHADLFRALPWSHGTLGLLVALELRVLPAPRYVRLAYRPFHDGDAYMAAHQAQLAASDSPFFLEGQVFGRNRAVLIEGHLATPEEVATNKLPVNDVHAWYKPFFYKHCETMLERGGDGTVVHEELVPTYSYLMRHERSMCMTMGSIIPTANKWWYRRLFGWMLPPNMELLKKSRPQHERASAMRGQVYQDFAFPAQHFQALIAHLDEEFAIYPLLVYPCRVFDKGGIVRLPGERGKDWDGQVRSQLYMNLGIYGIPKAVRAGNTRYPTITKVREVEEMIRQYGGFLHTYVDVLSTRAEFERMFDHSLWQQMRTRYGGDGVFPTIYDKVKPELDPLQFLAEEAAWQGASASKA